MHLPDGESSTALVYSIPLPIKSEERIKKGDTASQRGLELWSETMWEGWTFSRRRC